MEGVGVERGKRVAQEVTAEGVARGRGKGVSKEETQGGRGLGEEQRAGGRRREVALHESRHGG